MPFRRIGDFIYYYFIRCTKQYQGRRCIGKNRKLGQSAKSRRIGYIIKRSHTFQVLGQEEVTFCLQIMQDGSQWIASAKCSVRFTDGDRKGGQRQGMLRTIIQFDIFAASDIWVREQLVNDDFSGLDQFCDSRNVGIIRIIRDIGSVWIYRRIFLLIGRRINGTGSSTTWISRKMPA